MVGSDKNSVLASNASDGQMTLFTPYSSDQMIINLSMKIGEVDSGSTRLLAAVGGEKCHLPITCVAR